MDCQDLSFDAKLSEQRMEKAVSVLGARIVKRVIGFALYLMGVNRSTVARKLGIPRETAKSFIKTVLRDGPAALGDRRRRYCFSPSEPQPAPVVKLFRDGDWIVAQFGSGEQSLRIPADNLLQVRSVLLSMYSNGLITAGDASRQLGVTGVHVRNMARRLQDGDVSALIDKRQGQKHDYVVTSEIKGELIQQFVVELLVYGKTSGRKLAEELCRRRQITVAERTVRHHLSALGLQQIRKTLPELFEAVKKTPKTGTGHG